MTRLRDARSRRWVFGKTVTFYDRHLIEVIGQDSRGEQAGYAAADDDSVALVVRIGL